MVCSAPIFLMSVIRFFITSPPLQVVKRAFVHRNSLATHQEKLYVENENIYLIAFRKNQGHCAD
jgi:hypothetical protein